MECLFYNYSFYLYIYSNYLQPYIMPPKNNSKKQTKKQAKKPITPITSEMELSVNIYFQFRAKQIMKLSNSIPSSSHQRIKKIKRKRFTNQEAKPESTFKRSIKMAKRLEFVNLAKMRMLKLKYS